MVTFPSFLALSTPLAAMRSMSVRTVEYVQPVDLAKISRTAGAVQGSISQMTFMTGHSAPVNSTRFLGMRAIISTIVEDVKRKIYKCRGSGTTEGFRHSDFR